MQKSKLERVSEIEQAIERLKKRRLTLLQAHKVQERKARNHRLCKRSGFLEKVLPDLVMLTDEQFETFVKKTLQTSFADRILRGLLPAQEGKNECEVSTDAANRAGNTQAQKSAGATVNNVVADGKTSQTLSNPGGQHSAAAGESVKAVG